MTLENKPLSEGKDGKREPEEEGQAKKDAGSYVPVPRIVVRIDEGSRGYDNHGQDKLCGMD